MKENKLLHFIAASYGVSLDTKLRWEHRSDVYVKWL